MSKFLDLDGLSYYTNKIKSDIAAVKAVPTVTSSDDGYVLTATYSDDTGTYSWQPSSGGGGGSVSDFYGESTTAKTTSPKTASITGFTLTKGVTVSILFTKGFSLASSRKLNISSTGDITVYYNGSTTSSYTWGTNSIITFIYDGTYYRIISSEPGYKSASSGGADMSYVSTGEKYSWNNKSSLSLTSSTVPSASSGSGSVGSSSYAARADHVHPLKIETVELGLTTYTYTQSGGGMYYSQDINVGSFSTIYSVTPFSFSNLRADDYWHIVLSADRTKVRIWGNRNATTWSASAKISVLVIGLP